MAARARKRWKQMPLPRQIVLGVRGGWRPGAGRPKRKGAVSHLRREALKVRTPLHVVVRCAEEVRGLRRWKVAKVLSAAFRKGCWRDGFRLVHFSVMGNHIHLVVEADSAEALSEGMRAWTIRVARAINPQPLRLRDTLISKQSFVVVAAGNEAAEVRADLFPQSAASIFPEFINVSHGAADGALFGSSTGRAGGGKVDVLAPGCGIAFERLRATDSGSSYAAPIVAAAAWIKSLLDSTPAAEMRAHLMQASLLVPPRTSPFVISGGVFDPARLLSGVGAHYLDPMRTTLHPLEDVVVDAGACGTFRSSRGAPPSQDLIAYQRGGKNFILRRHRTSDFPGVRLEDECAVSSLTVTALGTPGLQIPSFSEFVGRVGHLTF
jgi:REP element-mobilizing transposase RayT